MIQPGFSGWLTNIKTLTALMVETSSSAAFAIDLIEKIWTTQHRPLPIS